MNFFNNHFIRESIILDRRAGPPAGVLATVFTILFLAGLYPVTYFAGLPYFPGPWETADRIASYFETCHSAVLACAFFHFGAAIPVGLLTATLVSRLRFLGVPDAGAYIALFGGFLTAFDMVASSPVLWVVAHPGIARDRTVTEALFYVQNALGGPGFSVPFGLLMAGVSIPAAFLKLLPKWVIGMGLVLALAGELSWLNLVLPGALFLIPLTRFPGFLWLILGVPAARNGSPIRYRGPRTGPVTDLSRPVHATNPSGRCHGRRHTLFVSGPVQHGAFGSAPFTRRRILAAAI